MTSFRQRFDLTFTDGDVRSEIETDLPRSHSSRRDTLADPDGNEFGLLNLYD